MASSRLTFPLQQTIPFFAYEFDRAGSSDWPVQPVIGTCFTGDWSLEVPSIPWLLKSVHLGWTVRFIYIYYIYIIVH